MKERGKKAEAGSRNKNRRTSHGSRSLIPASFSVLLVVCLSAVFTFAAEPSSKDLDAQIRRLGEQVAQLAGKQQSLWDRLDLLKRRVRLTEATLDRIKEEREAASSAVVKARADLESLKAENVATKRYLLGRMRERYALGLLQEYRVYFAVGGTQDMREAGLYLSALAQRDKAALAEYAESIPRQEAAQTTLAQSEARLKKAEAMAASERQSLIGQQSQLTLELDKLGRERETSRKALDETLQAARSMDRYLKDLSFKTRVDMYSKDMSQAKGHLPMPLAGRVAIGYGDYVHPRFHTRIPHPGLDIDAQLGAPVQAVFDGTVAFAGWLSGYGYTVILSHPGGFFTIYSHLDEVRAKDEEVVAQGSVIGTAGGDANRGTTGIYFELRAGDRAIDPAPWFAPSKRGQRALRGKNE